MNWYTRLDTHLETQATATGPVRGTLSLPRIGMIWLAANLVVTTLLTGTLFIPGLQFSTALWVILLGTASGAVVLVLVGNIGTRTGLPTMALTRGAFGTRGSYLPLTANVVILMGWSWVQAMLAGVTVDYLVHSLTGFSHPVLFSMLCQALVVILAIFGHEGIARVEPWFAVLILAIIVYVFVRAFSTFSFGEFEAIPVDAAQGYTPAIGFDVVFATAISWTVLSGDFNRLAGSSRAGVIGSGVGYTLSTVISMSVGLVALGYVVLSGGEAIQFDPGVLVGAFGAPIAISIFLSVMATNTMVVYGMVTSVVNHSPSSRLRFLPTALVLGAVSILGASWLGLLDQFTDFLVMIGAFFVPVFAIMIADYYLIKRASYTRDLVVAGVGRYWYRAGINLWSFAAWIAGAAVTYALTYAWPSPVGATVPAFAVSFAIYALAMIPARRAFAHRTSTHLLDQLEAPADARPRPSDPHGDDGVRR